MGTYRRVRARFRPGLDARLQRVAIKVSYSRNTCPSPEPVLFEITEVLAPGRFLNWVPLPGQ